MNTPESVKASATKSRSTPSPNLKRDTLQKKGVTFNEEVLSSLGTEHSGELPRHIDCVRQSLLNFTYSLPSSVDISHYFQTAGRKLVDEVEDSSYQNWSFFPPCDSEQHSVWWAPVGSCPSRGPDPRDIPLWANVEECNQVVKNLKSERLGMEVDWTERLRLAVFRKYDEKAVEANDEPQSVSGLPASHEIEPFERWCLARDAQWVEADTFYDRKHLKTPTPDLTYAFPILNSPFTGFAAQETLGTIFSLDVLRDLRNDANIKLISSPTCGLKNDDNGSPKSDLNKTNLMCFPWAIVEIKHPRVNKTDIEYCYCQAANDSAIALRMLGALFRKATGCLPADLPPIVAITCIGPELRVWLTYNAGTGGGREDDMNISMRCVYATHLELVWGVHSSRLIVKHMHVWASRILKPRICMYLSLLASTRSLSSQTMTTPSARSSSDTMEDSGAYSSSDESSILPDDSPSGRKFKSSFINECAPDFVAPDISSTPSPSRVNALKRTTTSTAKKSNKNFTTPSPPQVSASKMSTSSNAKGSNKKSIPGPRTPQSQTPFEVRQGMPSFTPILKLREETLGASRSQQTPLKSEKEPVPNFESIGSLEVDALVIELEDLVAKFQKLGVSASSTPIQETRRSSYFYIRRKALAATSRPPSGRGDETSPRREFPVGKRFGVEDDKQQFWNWTLGASDYDHSADVALTLTLASIVVLTLIALTDL